jgi:surface protein
MKIAEYKFNNTLYNLIPEFNAEFTNYTYEDIVDGNTTTRTIYSDSLPTLIGFGKRGMESDSSISLLEVNYLNTSNITDMSFMFSFCKSLTSVNTDNWDTSNVERMVSMFYWCESLTQLNVNSFNIDKVTDINRVFAYCLKLTSLDLSNWNISNVTDINRTFTYCSQMTELNLSGWNVDKVADTNMTFAYCNNLDTIKIYNCKANMISTLNWSSLFPTEIISGKTRTIYCDEALVGKMEPPTNWVLSTEKEYNIKVAEYKFINTLYNLIPEFNATFNYTYEDIVEGNTTTRTIYSDSLPNLIRFGINSDNEFGDNKSLSLLEVLSLNADNLSTCQRMFKACENVKSINCENVTINNAHEMFAFCCSLNTLNANSYDMSNATNINNMFYYCNNLTSLDISNWNLNGSVDTSNLFNSCFSLNNITMNNSDYNSVNKIIAELPTKSSNSMGTLNITGVDNINQVDEATANSKYWLLSLAKTTVNNICIGGINISELNIGPAGVKQVYLGDILIYENKNVVNDKIIMLNENINTLFILGDGLLQYDEQNLNLTISDDINVIYDEDESNLTIGGEE